MEMKIFYRLTFILVFLVIFGVIVAYARGYRIDFDKKSLTPTGIISVSSSPKAAKIFVNDVLKGVTDTNLTLPPGTYKVDIKKDGYTSYSKGVSLKGELVVSIDALLFPVNSTFSPLTNLGLVKAIPVGDTEKVIIFVDKESAEEGAEKSGIYLFEGGRKPLPFFPPLTTIILKSSFPPDMDFSRAKVTISPDAKEAIFEFGLTGDYVDAPPSLAYLLSLEDENPTPFDVSQSKKTLIEAWNKQKLDNNLKILETYPDDFYKIASDSVEILSFAPSETKLLYKANKNLILPPMITPALIATNQTPEQRSLEKGKIYVYDKKEDKNYLITTTEHFTDQNDSLVVPKDDIRWYFDSRHLLVNQGKKIVVIDYDDTNKQTVYSGPYDSSFFTTTEDGKIITLSNLNPEVNKWPDLYLIGTR